MSKKDGSLLRMLSCWQAFKYKGKKKEKDKVGSNQPFILKMSWKFFFFRPKEKFLTPIFVKSLRNINVSVASGISPPSPHPLFVTFETAFAHYLYH